MDKIETMRAFVSVARQSSFTDGAKQLGISTKVASKYVRQLEEHLGAQLLYRTTRSVSLTETGSAYFDRCVPLLEQLDELEGVVQVRQSELAGPIRITAPTGFGSSELIKGLQPFQRAHPKVTLDLHLSDQHVSLIEEGYDIAIRFGTLADSSLMARRLLEMKVVVYASPDYLAQHGRPTHPKELSQHNCLLFRSSADGKYWQFSQNDQLVSQPVDGSFYADSPRAIATMAVGGLGIGRGPQYAVQSYLDNNELQLLLEGYDVPAIGLYAVYPQSRHVSARIRALIDHLAAYYLPN
jgi:DNA-binding transcriptional LysR family regulator